MNNTINGQLLHIKLAISPVCV